MLKIVTVPNSVLVTQAKPVEKVDNKIRKIVYEMEEILISQVDPQGVGLAAPQVGLPLQLFIVKPTLNVETEVFINPEILETKNELTTKPEASQSSTKRSKASKLEGCLSIPRIWGPVHRPVKVKLKYLDLQGYEKTTWFTGLKATIIQHEVDHLKGILFTQRALEQNISLYEEKEGEFVKLTFPAVGTEKQIQALDSL